MEERGGGTGRLGPAEMPFAAAAMAPSRLPRRSHGTGPPLSRGRSRRPGEPGKGGKVSPALDLASLPLLRPDGRAGVARVRIAAAAAVVRGAVPC